jgi:hypothetical protein
LFFSNPYITLGVGDDHLAEVDFGGNLAASLRCLRVNGGILRHQWRP